MIPLKNIEYVLLDMDGTLLDLYFDDYFWESLLPEKYAEKHSLPLEKAKDYLFAKYKAYEGTLSWTDLDFWSRELKIDLPTLKQQISHMIKVHPHVHEFLSALKKNGKKVYMVTNAHYKSLNIKMNKTGIGKYFDRLVTSGEIGYPKERVEFWIALEKNLNFEKDKTVFIDDTVDILKVACEYGIAYVLHKIRTSSKKLDQPLSRFQAIRDFNELMELFYETENSILSSHL